MLKKIATALLILSVSSVTIADDEKIIEKRFTASESTISTLDRLIDGYKRPELDSLSKEYEDESIKKINELYFSIDNYNQEELNEIFVNLIALGLNDAADHILKNENVVIDINGYNKNGITPIMAAAVSKMDGGNAEYAVKLIKMGADVNKSTEGTELSPTSMAAITNNYKVLAIFIATGAKFMKEDRFDSRPIDYAIANNSEKSAEILAESLSSRIKIEEEKKKDLTE